MAHNAKCMVNGTSYLFKDPKDITKLKYEKWKKYLQHCPLEDAQWVLQGILNGFPLLSNSNNLVHAKKNLISATSQPDVISNYLKLEIEYGHIAGPFNQPPFGEYQLNRVGIIPVSNKKFRLITDLSFPKGACVNDGIIKENFNVSYVGVTEAIKKIKKYGQGCVIAKFDLQRAYRLLPICMNDRKLLVMKWQGKYYVDLCLPFGARSAPQTFTRFADILQWIFMTHGKVDEMQHSLDDFFTCASSYNACQENLKQSFALCEELGVSIEPSKTEGPSTRITFLGLVIDTELMEISIPSDKLTKIQLLIEDWLIKQTGSKRSLLSLIGSLYYCSQVVVTGRLFQRNLVARAYSVDRLNDKVKLTSKELNDLKWWFYLLMSWNGRSYIHDIHGENVKLHS